MSFIITAVGGSAAAAAAGTAAAATLGGAYMSSKSAKRATDAAVAGSERELEFSRESRDLARADTAPYREAGTTALSAMMDMTGLSTPTPADQWNAKYTDPSRPQSGVAKDVYGIPDDVNAGDWMRQRYAEGEAAGIWDQPDAGSQYAASNPWASRAPAVTRGVMGRAYGGSMGEGSYNINELGPENVYSGGAVTRNSQPQTIAPSQAGYVQPHGRANGGPIGPQYGWGGPQQVTGGVTDPRQSGPKVMEGYGGFDPNMDLGGGRTPSTGGPLGPTPVSGPQQGGTYDQQGNVVENPGGREGGYSFQADPGYNFRLQEGIRARDRSAAARGQSLSGGTQRQLERYGQDYASGEYQNVYNRIANIAGLGQVSSQGAGQQAIQTGQMMGQAAGQGGMSSAYGQMAQGNAWAGAANQIANLPWGKVFNRGGGGGAAGGEYEDYWSGGYNP